MIGALRGTVLRMSQDEIVLDVSGVGYLLQLSAQALSSGLRVGSTAEFVVYTDVKENAIVLFGFQSWLEREVFLLLKKVKGIGPKLAMAIVSALGPEGVLQAVGRKDIAQLKSVPGVGKKTAERLLIELAEYVVEFASEAVPSVDFGRTEPLTQFTVGAPASPSGPANDAALALEKLGFSKERAVAAVRSALQDPKAQSFQQDPGELLRLSLSHL